MKVFLQAKHTKKWQRESLRCRAEICRVLGMVPDPCSAENLERSCGRGLLLMKSHMTWVRFNARGNCVTLGKRRLK